MLWIDDDEQTGREEGEGAMGKLENRLILPFQPADRSRACASTCPEAERQKESEGKRCVLHRPISTTNCHSPEICPIRDAIGFFPSRAKV
jgi:hypothetical protein